MHMEVTLTGAEINQAIAGIVKSKTGNANIKVSSWKAKKGNKALIATCETIETIVIDREDDCSEEMTVQKEIVEPG
jgi:hypothetical protein